MDTGTKAALIVGGAAVLGVGIYIATRPKPVSSASTSDALAPPNQAVAETPTPPTTRYSQVFQPGGSIQLSPGDSITISPMSPAPAGWQWEFQVNGGLTAIQWSPTNAPSPSRTLDLATFVAQDPGTWTLTADQFVPGRGNNSAALTMTITIVGGQAAPVIPL